MGNPTLVYPISQAEKARLSRKFGRGMWHSVHRIVDPQMARVCYCCFEPAQARIEVNIWGTVHQYDVCAEHAAFDGLNCDGVPARAFDPIALGC